MLLIEICTEYNIEYVICQEVAETYKRASYNTNANSGYPLLSCTVELLGDHISCCIGMILLYLGVQVHICLYTSHDSFSCITFVPLEDVCSDEIICAQLAYGCFTC